MDFLGNQKNLLLALAFVHGSRDLVSLNFCRIVSDVRSWRLVSAARLSSTLGTTTAQQSIVKKTKNVEISISSPAFLPREPQKWIAKLTFSEATATRLSRFQIWSSTFFTPT